MNYDVIIVGGGIAGASLLHALTHKGVRKAVMLEMGGLASGSTGQSAAMVRVYHQSPELVALAAESLPRYREFEREVGISCGYQETGSLYFESVKDLKEVYLKLRRLQAAGVAVELLDRKAGERRFPQIQWPERAVGVFEPRAGYADPKRTVEAWAQRAVELGAEIRQGVPVDRLLVHEGSVVGVGTPRGELKGKQVVLAAGAWSAELAAGAGVSVAIERRTIQLQRFRGREVPGRHPIFFDRTHLSYGRSDGERASWVGTLSQAGRGVTGEVDRRETRLAKTLASRTLRGLHDSRLTAAFRAQEAYTPGRMALAGEVKGTPGLWMSAGFSGTGFKIAPAVAGRLAAQVARRVL